MTNVRLDEIVEQARRAAAEQARTELRARLGNLPFDLLLDQLTDRIMAELGLGSAPVAIPVEVHRVRQLPLDEDRLAEIAARLSAFDRHRFEAEGYLVDSAPKGGPLIGSGQRSAAAAALLCEAKDLLYALLFGQAQHGVVLSRVSRELLTLTVPATKLGVFSFLGEAATEIGARGTWRDPAGSAHDAAAANTLLQVEYGETAAESVGRGIVAALKVINDLEVNEQILYARMEDVEDSTLV